MRRSSQNLNCLTEGIIFAFLNQRVFCTIKKYNYSYKMFHRQTLDVTFFDAFGVEFEQKLRLAKQQEVVVVICAAKISLYEGM